MADSIRPLRISHSRSNSQTQIEVTVRSGSKYVLPKDTLCSYSDTFRVGLKDTNKLSLPDVSDSTFDLFQFWLYGQATRAKPTYIPNKPSSKGRSPVKITQIFADSENLPTIEEGNSNQLQLYDNRTGRDNSLLTPTWLMELNIDIDFSKPSWSSSPTNITKETFLNHFSNRTFIDLAAFAEDFHVTQLAQDIMVLIVELYSLNPYDRAYHWTKDDIDRLYRSLPANSHLIRYAVKEMATSDNTTLYDELACQHMPKEFFVDLCRVLISSRRHMKAELRDCCCFHDHRGLTEFRRCKERQAKDGTFYASLLKRCVETEVGFCEELRQTWASVENGLSKREVVCLV